MGTTTRPVYWLALTILFSCVRPSPLVTNEYAQTDLDTQDKCSTEPEDADGFQDQDGCPELDNDQDGLADALDLCPNDAEDLDKVVDKDGCPELDADSDLIADQDDKCPTEPEDKDEVHDEDGCPEKSPRVVMGGSALVSVEVTFELNKSQLSKEAIESMDPAAERLSIHPVQMIIFGYALKQEKGGEKLALKRANAVRDYLISHGVDPTTLETKGYVVDDPEMAPGAEFMMCIPIKTHSQ